jgi:NAD(P)-dependent dehydrogenase (short-subunit alcohol dehydrogenase family)
MKFEGKVFVVTGAASGMGRSLAIQLATKEGAAGVAICDVNQKELEETARLAKEAGSKATIRTYLCDVSNRARVEEWRDEVVRDFGFVDMIFNNAGINANGKQVYDKEDDIAMLERNWDRCRMSFFFFSTVQNSFVMLHCVFLLSLSRLIV